jgi:small-conductance mechanosensitive channel
MMDWVLLDRPGALWVISGASFLAIVLAIPLVLAVLRRRFDPVRHHPWSWPALIGRLCRRWLRMTTLLLGAGVAALVLRPDPPGDVIVRAVLVGACAVQALLLVGVLVDWALRRIGRARAGGETPEGEQAALSTLAGLRWLALGICYALIVLLALQNLGVDVTALVAGLGIGGIAVALAVQNILGDLFASLTIALDKPFVGGDFIIVGSDMGTVEHVGLKTTRVRSLWGEQLVFGNADLLSSRIRNFKRMNQRRVVFGFGVVYQTPPDIVEAIPGIVRECIEAGPGVKFDRCHFYRFGASSLDFEAVYYVNTPDYNTHMDVQQGIHLAIARRFRERGIAFAFPTQTVHLAAQAGSSAPAAAGRA